MQVVGTGTISIKTNKGNVKLLHNVQYVPSLAHNFLSVGQLLKGGYVVLFDDECCYISDKQSGQKLFSIPMAQNKMFPLDVLDVEKCA